MAERLEIIVTANDQASKALGGIRNALGGIASVAGGIITSQIITSLSRQFVQFGKDVIGEVGAAQEMQAQLNAVLKSTGGIAGVTAKSVNDLADSLSKTTRYEDEAIISAENMLLTFTKIGKDVFPDVTKTVLDMSTAMGQDLKTSAIQVGKALNNPEEGITALTRVGVKFTKEQEKMIKSLTRQGKVAEAQKLILQELQTEFGGSAEAAGTTFSGKMDILTNRFNNFKEEIGFSVLPILEELMGSFSGFTDDALPKITEFISTKLVPGFHKLAQTINGLTTGKTSLADLIPPEILAIIQPVITAFEKLAKTIQADMPMAQQAIAEAFAFIQETFAGVMPQIIDNVATSITTLTGIWETHGETIMSVMKLAFETIGIVIANTLLVITTVISGALVLIEAIMNSFSMILQGNWQGAWNNVLVTIQTIWTLILETFQIFFDTAGALVGINLETFRAVWQSNWDTLKLIVDTVFQNIITDLNAQITKFREIGKNIIEGLKAGVKAAAAGLVTEVVAAVRAAYNAAKNWLNINSPSKRFMSLGASVVKGFEKGTSGLGTNILPMLNKSFDQLRMSGYDLEPSKGNPVNSNSEQNFYAPINVSLESGSNLLQTLSALG